MKKRKVKLTVFLFKKDSKDNIIQDQYTQKEDIGGGTLYFEESIENAPTWVTDFFTQYTIIINKLKTKNARAVYVKEVQIDEEKRKFALCFGYGKSMINLNTIEERFGLKTVLNCIDSQKISTIQKRDIGYTRKISIDQMPKLSSVENFGINKFSDILRIITGKSIYPEICEGNITGADSFIANANVTLNNVDEYLIAIYKRYVSSDYKKYFDWVDNINEVTDKITINRLDEQLISSINDVNDTDFYLAPPIIFNWESISVFKVPFVGDVYNELDIKQLIKIKPKIDLNTLKSNYVRLIGNDNNEIDKWNLYKCLVGELVFEEKVYCLDNGRWYSIVKEYADLINKYFEGIKSSGIDYANNSSRISESESNFNERFANQEVNNYLLMDSKLINQPDYSSPIEMCDILTSDGLLLHNKIYSSSSVLSHLFNQGLVSLELIMSDFNFVDNCNAKIQSLINGEGKKNLFEDFKISKEKIKGVVFGIIKKGNNKRSLPFFSKVVLKNACNKIKDGYGKEVYIDFIKSDNL